MTFELIYNNQPHEIPWLENQNLLQAIQSYMDIPISAPCAGKGQCGKCKVRILKGKAPVTDEQRKHLSQRELDQNIRLACLMNPFEGLSMELPQSTDKKALGLQLETKSLKEIQGPYSIITDIGTTTVAMILLDNQAHILRQVTRENRQSSFGADVVSRMKEASESTENRNNLHEIIRRELAELLEEVTQGFPRQEILSWRIAGNTVMMHFLYDMDTAGMAQAPFEPESLTAPECSAEDLGISGFPALKVNHFPCISSYVGADITAGIIASSMVDTKETVLLVDIGTNGEMALSHKGKLLACSTAAGPAFEGGHLSSGCGSIDGAVDHVWIEDRVSYSTIEEAPAQGICGSGIVDFLAVMVELAIVDETGYIDSENWKDEWTDMGLVLVEQENNPKVVFKDVPGEIGISQKDVREIQLAKAAIAAGIETLLRSADLDENALDSLVLAGGFGTYLNHHNAGRIGLIPSALVEKVLSRGNTCALGLRLTYQREGLFEESFNLVKEVSVVDLNAHPEFQDFYVENMLF